VDVFLCPAGLYGLSRIVAWCFFSSSAILFAPLIFEVERAQVEEMQRSQQKQVSVCMMSVL
jgi:import receptor subunit TOM22